MKSEHRANNASDRKLPIQCIMFRECVCACVCVPLARSPLGIRRSRQRNVIRTSFILIGLDPTPFPAADSVRRPSAIDWYKQPIPTQSMQKSLRFARSTQPADQMKNLTPLTRQHNPMNTRPVGRVITPRTV